MSKEMGVLLKDGAIEFVSKEAIKIIKDKAKGGKMSKSGLDKVKIKEPEHDQDCRCAKCDWNRARYETEFEDNQD